MSDLVKTLKLPIITDLGLYHSSFDKNDSLIGDLIDCLKGLRNAIAHNGVYLTVDSKKITLENNLQNILILK